MRGAEALWAAGRGAERHAHTVPGQRGQRIGVREHRVRAGDRYPAPAAGPVPGAVCHGSRVTATEEITKATVKVAYDGQEASPAGADTEVVQEDGEWYAEVDDTGASGKSTSLLVDLTTKHGGSVEQRVIDGYGVR
ncbi:hypothetical protein [Streptomyces sp. NPDC052494]|uniref:hypothetical protein n=1 Tax=Streptomyces sp. NPDC052494 TaxID=3365692 RepID=UPI0037D2F3D8